MKVLAVNGSPRRNGNTAALLESAMRGAKENNSDIKLVHLYEQSFKGCISCFSCKRKGNHCNGICAVQDDLRDILEYALTCDVLLLGSPIYFAGITGEMHSFLERLLLPNYSYNVGDRSAFHGKIRSAFIYTMNLSQEQMKQMNYERIFEKNQELLGLFHGTSKILISNDTYQFKDYSLYEASRYDAAHKAKVRAEQFPVDIQRAFDLGCALTKG